MIKSQVHKRQKQKAETPKHEQLLMDIEPRALELCPLKVRDLSGPPQTTVSELSYMRKVQNEV